MLIICNSFDGKDLESVGNVSQASIVNLRKVPNLRKVFPVSQKTSNFLLHIFTDFLLKVDFTDKNVCATILVE